MEAAKDVYESETVRRAVRGVQKVWKKKDGTEVVETVYSDVLMVKLLEYSQTGSRSSKTSVELSQALTFQTAADRQAALEEARQRYLRDSAVDAGA